MNYNGKLIIEDTATDETHTEGFIGAHAVATGITVTARVVVVTAIWSCL